MAGLVDHGNVVDKVNLDQQSWDPSWEDGNIWMALCYYYMHTMLTKQLYPTSIC